MNLLLLMYLDVGDWAGLFLKHKTKFSLKISQISNPYFHPLLPILYSRGLKQLLVQAKVQSGFWIHKSTFSALGLSKNHLESNIANDLKKSKVQPYQTYMALYGVQQRMKPKTSTPVILRVFTLAFPIKPLLLICDS